MGKKTTLEYWQRGPVPEIPSLLQPVAHALLQAGEEIAEMMQTFPSELLWEKPAGAASCGFHLQHISGVIDRLFTYARNEKLNDKQFEELALEGKNSIEGLTILDLINKLSHQIDAALEQLKHTNESSLTDFRAVGAGLPSTVIGLLFHAAEHTMRHLGQLLVTSKVVLNKEK